MLLMCGTALMVTGILKLGEVYLSFKCCVYGSFFTFLNFSLFLWLSEKNKKILIPLLRLLLFFQFFFIFHFLCFFT